MNYQPYPKYRESGVQWLGEVPEHWAVKRLKLIVRNIDKKVEADEDNPLQYVGLENIESWYGKLIDLNSDTIPSGIANHFSSKNTLFGKLRPYLAKACNPDFDGLCSTELIVLEPVELIRRVLLFCLLADGFIKLVNSSAYGTKMPRSNWGFIGNCLLPQPPKEEQTAIADFLDSETGRIDTLVAKNKKLIELLKEERSALISLTVTRGLPEDAAIEYGLEPHTRFKDSGVEWLGDVPEDWEVKRLKYSASINDEILPETTKPDFDFLYVDIGSVTLLEGIIRKESMTFEDAPSRARRKARAGDAIVSTVRTYLRAIASIPETDDVLIVSTGFAVIRSRLLCPRYLGYALKESSFVEQVVARSVGVSYPAVNASEIGDIAIPLPSENEQTAIADFLDCETGRIDNLIGKVEALITRLQEYRIAIITDAVTGKIDVREMAA